MISQIFIFLFFCLLALIIIKACNKYKILKMVSPIALALLLGIILGQLPINLANSEAVGFISSTLVFISISLFLVNSDYKLLFTKYPGLVLLFLITAFATLIGYVITLFIFPELKLISTAMMSTYIGGSVNLLASSELLDLSSANLSQIIIADNILTALYLLLISFLLSKDYKPSMTDNRVKHKDLSGQVITLVIYVVLTQLLYKILLNYLPGEDSLIGLLINKYTLIVIISLFFANIFKKYFKNLTIHYEIANLLLIIYFLTIGLYARLSDFNSEIIIVFIIGLIIITCNVFITYLLGKKLNFKKSEIYITSNSAIGGPTTAFSYAEMYGFNDLLVGSLIIGSQGYVIAFFIVNIISKFIT